MFKNQSYYSGIWGQRVKKGAAHIFTAGLHDTYLVVKRWLANIEGVKDTNIAVYINVTLVVHRKNNK